MMDSESAGLDRLIRRACRREPAALQELVRRYGRRVHGLVHQMTGSRDTAEDLTQDTFLRVVRTIDEYRHDGKFEAWLFRIAANLARDHLRRQKRRGPTFGFDNADRDAEERGGFEPADSRHDPPGRAAEKIENETRLSRALTDLTETDREILLLRHYSEMPFGEIAEMLGVPLGTALARAHRALKRLKSAMEDQD